MPVATFDFDSTCTLPIWNEEDELWSVSDKPNNYIIREIQRLAASGYLVYIVSTRSEDQSAEVWEFVRKHNLPIVDVFCVDGDKGETLKRLNSDIHFDDMEQRYDDANGLHPGIWIKIFHPADLRKQV